MANKKIWLGRLVMILVFGMMVVGCEEAKEEVMASPVAENLPLPVFRHNIMGGM